MGTTAEQVLRTLRERERARQQAAHERAQRLAGVLPELKALLVERFGARRIWLFGSLALGTAHLGSDIDLATEGLPPERYFEALAEAMRIARADVDLVRLEEAPQSLRERVAEEGREL
jgi:predicted nucleotidyltransferase